jgi:hypothetical protein
MDSILAHLPLLSWHSWCARIDDIWQGRRAVLAERRARQTRAISAVIRRGEHDPVARHPATPGGRPAPMPELEWAANRKRKMSLDGPSRRTMAAPDRHPLAAMTVAASPEVACDGPPDIGPSSAPHNPLRRRRRSAVGVTGITCGSTRPARCHRAPVPRRDGR